VLAARLFLSRDAQTTGIMTEDDSIKFDCQYCGQSIEAPLSMRGMELDCLACTRTIRVPEANSTSASLYKGKTGLAIQLSIVAAILLFGSVLYFQSRLLSATNSLAQNLDKKKGWDYRVVEVENIAGYMKESAFEEMKTNGAEWMEHSRQADNTSGDFNFDTIIQMGKYGADLAAIGREGWELVAAVPQMETLPLVEYQDGTIFNPATGRLDPNIQKFNNIRTKKIVLIFKK
jgi:hypothetical protein